MSKNDENTLPRITTAEIPWRLEPLEPVENVDTLAMTVAELLADTADLQDESRGLRQVVHESLAMIARQRDQLTRAARVTDALRCELRALREDAAA